MNRNHKVHANTPLTTQVPKGSRRLCGLIIDVSYNSHVVARLAMRTPEGDKAVWSALWMLTDWQETERQVDSIVRLLQAELVFALNPDLGLFHHHNATAPGGLASG